MRREFHGTCGFDVVCSRQRWGNWTRARAKPLNPWHLGALLVDMISLHLPEAKHFFDLLVPLFGLFFVQASLGNWDQLFGWLCGHVCRAGFARKAYFAAFSRPRVQPVPFSTVSVTGCNWGESPSAWALHPRCFSQEEGMPV